MGVSTTTNRVLTNGDGSTTAFSFPYYFFDQTDLDVFLYDTTAFTITPQVLSTHYTISGSVNYQGIYSSGGTVNFLSAPANTKVAVIVRAGLLEQTFAIQENGSIPSQALVQQLDYLTLLVQRLQDQISRVPIVPDGVGVAWSGALPDSIADQPGKVICVNASGNGFDLSDGQWNSVTYAYSDLQIAATTNSKLVIALPANTLLTGLFAKISTGFAGTSISAIVGGIGISSDHSYFMSPLDMSTGNNSDGSSSFYLGSFSGSTNINLYVTATGANLSQLSIGSITLFYKTEALA